MAKDQGLRQRLLRGAACVPPAVRLRAAKPAAFRRQTHKVYQPRVQVFQRTFLHSNVQSGQTGGDPRPGSCATGTNMLRNLFCWHQPRGRIPRWVAEHVCVRDEALQLGVSLLLVVLRRCGCSCLLPPKDIQRPCGTCRAFIGPQDAVNRLHTGYIAQRMRIASMHCVIITLSELPLPPPPPTLVIPRCATCVK